uniref:ATP synthase subunit a n=1 Tax=Spondylus violaceus TaxID=1163653 RepID=A0A515MNP5_9BIVA|nr:ATP synthase F0 subunit 6 [Spondylus violaceus]
MYSYFDQFVPGWSGSIAFFWGLPFALLIWASTKFFGESSRASVFMDEFYLFSLAIFEGLGLKGVAKAGSIHLLVCLFSVLVVMNYLGLVPFVYPVTSHPCGVFFFVILFWGIGGLPMLVNPLAFLSGFRVKGVGVGFQVLVVFSEVLSWFARPVILGVRMLANVICGHLLMASLSHLGCALAWGGNLAGFLGSFVALGGFLLMESLVLGIQAYVFMLIVLYTLSEGFFSSWVGFVRGG